MRTRRARQRPVSRRAPCLRCRLRRRRPAAPRTWGERGEQVARRRSPGDRWTSPSATPEGERGGEKRRHREWTGNARPGAHENHPARRIFSRSRSAAVSVAFITGRVTSSSAHLENRPDEALDPDPGVLPSSLAIIHHRSVSPEGFLGVVHTPVSCGGVCRRDDHWADHA